MTKKNYVALAEWTLGWLAERHGIMRESAVEFLVEVVCPWLARDNPRFDRERFLRACGIDTRGRP